MLEYLQMVRDSCEGELEFHCGYEAGCRGYGLAKDLLAKGIDCAVMAPTTIDKPSDSSKKKTDRLDARLLARAPCKTSFFDLYRQRLLTEHKKLSSVEKTLLGEVVKRCFFDESKGC